MSKHAPTRHRKAVASASTAAILAVAGLAAAGFSLAGAQSARAQTSWPAHVFAPYVDTGLSNTTLTTVAADYGTKYIIVAGLLNLISVADAYHIAIGKKP